MSPRTGREPRPSASRRSGNNCGKLMSTSSRLYWRLGCPTDTALLSAIKHREADLPTKRTPSQAQARLSRANENPCRPRDLEAPPRARPQAAIGLTGRGVLRWSAGTAYLAREISTPSIVTENRHRPASSLSTCSRARKPAMRGWAWRSRRASARPSHATVSSARCGRSGARRSDQAASTLCWWRAPGLPRQRSRMVSRG